MYGPTLLWAEFAMGRVCYGPRCPVTGNLRRCGTLLYPSAVRCGTRF